MAAPTLLQTIKSKQWSGTSTTLTFDSACTNGSRIVAKGTVENGTHTIAHSDPTNGTYAIDSEDSKGNGGNAGDGRAAIESVANTATSALTVTLTPSASDSGMFTITEISASTLDSTAHSNGAASDNVVTLTTLTANCWGEACGTFYPNNSSTFDSGWTTDAGPTGVSNSYHFLEHNTDTGATGGKTVTFSDTGSENNWATAAAAYKSSGGGGGDPEGRLIGGKLINGGLLMRGVL